jgi:seryl-tRNA synthetase
MLDLKRIRQNPKEIEKILRHKQKDVDLAPILSLDSSLRSIKTETEELKSKRNALSSEIGQKKRESIDCSALMDEVAQIKKTIESLDSELKEKEEKLFELLSYIPNIPSKDVPLSLNPEENICIKEWGQKKVFPFAFKNHVELGESLGLFDFKRSAKMTGSHWPLYTDMGARLEWALIQYMIDVQKNNGFTFIMPPLLVRPEAMFGSGQLPKFASQLYQIKDDDYSLYLIPTSEVALNAMHMDEIIPEEELPYKYLAYTPCFRREAGASGTQERGLIRMHQFHKVEIFAVTSPEESEKMFEEMMESAEAVLQGLELHYRKMLLVSGDCSFSAAKTVDIEVFLPGQDRYMEVSSVSNCLDFQARRSKTRFRKGNDKPEYVHTLNGSALATSRVFVAILENFQKEDGTIEIPTVLHRYLENDVLHIGKK